MSNPFYQQLSPTPTPKWLNFFLALMTIATLASAFFPQFTPLFGLSEEGIDRFFYWQWLSYALFEPSSGGLSFSLIIQLGFSLYLLWIFGRSVIDRLGPARFISLFLGSAMIGGLAAWGLLKTFHTPLVFIDPRPALYGCMFAWTILNANATVLLFFAVPFNACRALYVFLGISLLIDLSHGNWPAGVALLAALAYAYLFTLISCQMLSPFSFMHPLEKIIIRASSRLKRWPGKSEQVYHSSKIYDIRSGKPVLDDEQFMDAMLTRISLYGEESLSPEDRKRMEQISARKRKK